MIRPRKTRTSAHPTSKVFRTVASSVCGRIFPGEGGVGFCVTTHSNPCACTLSGGGGCRFLRYDAFISVCMHAHPHIYVVAQRSTRARAHTHTPTHRVRSSRTGQPLSDGCSRTMTITSVLPKVPAWVGGVIKPSFFVYKKGRELLFSPRRAALIRLTDSHWLSLTD